MDASDPCCRFPATAPVISVEASERHLEPIDCQELQWWFATPRLGDPTAFAGYDVDTGELGFAHEVVSTVPVIVNGRDAVELLLSEWSRDRDGERTGIERFTCVLDEDRARWLAVTLHDGEARTLTKGDPEFDAGWAGTGPRRLVDSGRYQQRADGAYRTTGTPDMGAGVYRVSIGPRVFTCLRVFDLTPFGDESAELGVAFVEPGGRTVLYREYSTRTPVGRRLASVACRAPRSGDRHRRQLVPPARLHRSSPRRPHHRQHGHLKSTRAGGALEPNNDTRRHRSWPPASQLL